MIYISEVLLYISFSILAGYSLLSLIDSNKKPAIIVPAFVVPLCIIAIPILSFTPIHSLAWNNAATFKMSYFKVVSSVISEFQFGQAWLWTVCGSIGLLMIHTIPVFNKDKHMPKIRFLLVLLLAIWFGYASHAASLSTLKGLLVHSTHFIGVVLWLGVLFVVALFSQKPFHWEKFLNWFSPFAIANVLLVLLAGFTLMSFTTPQYINSWTINYGQMLLLKHISIIPLLWLAFTNGFMYKKYYLSELKLHPDNNTLFPTKWIRVEAILAVVVLIFTAIMGQKNPPHNLMETLQSEAPSKLFLLFYKTSFSPDLQLHLSFGLPSILLFIAATLTLYASYIAFKAKHTWGIIISCILFIACLYLALMVAIVN